MADARTSDGRGGRAAGRGPAAGRFLFLPGSLRGRLVGLVVLAIVPLLVLDGVLRHSEVAAAARNASEEARRLAAAAAGRQRHALERVGLLLQVAARSPEVASGDRETRERYFRTLLSDQPGLLNVGYVERDGTITASALAMPAPVDASGRRWFQRAMGGESRVAMGEFQVGRITHAPTLNVAVPVQRPDGAEAQGVLFAAVGLERLQAELRAEADPPGSVQVLLDTAGTILARHPPHAAARPGMPWPLADLLARAAGAGAEPVRGTSSDGVPRLWGFHPFGLPGGATAGTAVIGLEEAAVLAPFRRTLRLYWTFVVVTLAVSLLVARAVAVRAIATPLAAVAAAAGRVARGEPASLPSRPRGEGEIAALETAFRDMATTLERRAAEARAAEARLRDLLATMPAVHYAARVVDGRRAVEYVSPRLRELTGIDPAILTGGGTIEDHVVEADRDDVIAAVAAAAAEGGRLACEYRFAGAGGAPSWVRDSAVAIVTADGVRVVGFLTDIGERKDLEGRFLQAQKMEALGRLASAVAHDFNNLLTVISGYAELLAARVLADPRSASQVAEIRKAAERAEALTRQLLAFGRREPDTGASVNTDVNGQVAEMRGMLERLCGERVRLVLRLAPTMPPARISRGHLTQIVMNLAVNARDAMLTGGTLTIATEAVTLDEDYVRPHGDLRAGGYACVTVADTGCGMEDAVRERIFEPFFTTKGAGKGTGLGLSTIYGILRQARGHVEVYTAPWRGTTFKVYVPLAGSHGGLPAPDPSRISGQAGPSTPIPAGPRAPRAEGRGGASPASPP